MGTRLIAAGGVAGLAILLTPILGLAAEGDEALCRSEETRLETSRYLRAISLDVRGKLPSLDDYARMSAGEDALDGILDEWLATPEFRDRMVRHHRSLIWNNLANVPLMSYGVLLTPGTGGVLYRDAVARTYRGSEVSCLDRPVEYRNDGTIDWVDGTRVVMVDNVRVVEATRREGYVEVEPYWAPGTTVRICAWDAQTPLVSPSGAKCSSAAAHSDRHCGCGPNLQWCVTPQFSERITEAMAQDVDYRIRALLQDDAPYTDLFTSRRAFVNGPLAHFYRHLTGFPDAASLEPVPFEIAQLPNLPATAVDAWREIELPEYHAGLLTSPAYLLRFQTNRARANRLFDAFLCSPLTPPPGGLVFNQLRPIPDLQRRDGCKYCHANLEPTASFWGRWAEQGAGYLDPVKFPPSRSDCEACARSGEQCSAECSRFYIMSALTVEEEPYLGMLHSYQFRREQQVRHIEQGPRLLVLSAVVDSRFSQCVSKKIASNLLGRDVLPSEGEWVNDLARGFVTTDYGYKSLVKSVVKSDVYRRVR